MNVSGMPLHWTVTNQQVCEDGWGCQDTLLLTENGEKSPLGPKPGSHPLLCRDIPPRTQPSLHSLWELRGPLPSYQELSPPQQGQSLGCPVTICPVSHPRPRYRPSL